MAVQWIVVTKTGEAAALLGMWATPTRDVRVVAVGPQELAEEASCGTASVSWIKAEGGALDTYASAIADLISSAGDFVAFGYGAPVVREAFGMLAARAAAPSVSNVTSVGAAGAGMAVEHAVIDGKVIEALEVPVPVCLLADAATFQPVEADEAAQRAEIVAVEVAPQTFCEVVDVEPVPDSGVESAEIVVGVGRGVGSQEKFAIAKSLADALGAELSGSMPGVRDFGLFAPDADYVGLTGVRLNAKLYIALGISGSTPHLMGLMNAKTVVCINSDANAQLFNHADYGIVGAVEDVVPELVKALA